MAGRWCRHQRGVASELCFFSLKLAVFRYWFDSVGLSRLPMGWRQVYAGGMKRQWIVLIVAVVLVVAAMLVFLWQSEVFFESSVGYTPFEQ